MSESGAALDVVVYTQPHCAGCVEIERLLEEQHIAFRVRDVSVDVEALEEIADRGFVSTPVTRIGDHWVAGFRKKELERLLRGV